MSKDEKQQQLATEGEIEVEIFQNSEIRRTIHKGEWWFAVKDVIEAIIETPNGTDYIGKIRRRDKSFDERYRQIVEALEYDSAGGRQQTNFVNIEGIFRIMQSVPSPKAEPFKKWLAKVGFERVQEFQNPELAIKRAMAIYHAKGYPPEWIDARIPNKIARARLEEQWAKQGIKANVEYAVLTNAISEETFGIDTKRHKQVKSLGKSHNLRDNMTPIELTLTTLAEQATREIAESTSAKNFHAHKLAAKTGGSIAGQARANIESATGRPVVSRTNYLTEKQRQNMELPTNLAETIENVTKSAQILKHPKSK